jgi:hypothetical protein
MRPFALFAAALFAAALESSLAYAEVKRPASRTTAGEAIRYFQFSDGLMGDLPVDAFMREVRQGGNVVSAVLDVCYPVLQGAPRKDRFVVPLKIEGGKLSGVGQSQEGKLPITVNIARKQVGKNVSFEGSITRGEIKTSVSSVDNTDMSEKEFQEIQSDEILITATPKDFTAVSPDSVGILVKRESMSERVRELRDLDVQLVLEGLSPDCAALRSGQQVVHFYVDPERAPALVAKFKASPGVLAAGWMEGYSIESAVRFAAASWRGSNGKLDKEKLGLALAASAAKALGAALVSSTWDATTGELVLKLKTPNQAIAGLNLMDIIKLTLLVGPEKLGSHDNLILWLDDTVVDTVDEGMEPRFKFMEQTDDREGQGLYEETIIAGLTRDLNGRPWDTKKSAWK